MILLHYKIDSTRFEAEPLGCSKIQLRSKFQTLTVAEIEGFRLLRHSSIGCDGLKQLPLNKSRGYSEKWEFPFTRNVLLSSQILVLR